MQDNVQIITYRNFTFHGRSFKNVLRFHFKGGNGEKWSFWMLPDLEQGYFTLAGQGHVRGTVLANIRDDFCREDFGKDNPAEYNQIFEKYSALPDAISMESGTYV